MQDYRESTVVVARLWEDLFKRMPSAAAFHVTYAHGLLLLFLFSEHGVIRSRAAQVLARKRGQPPDPRNPLPDWERISILRWLERPSDTSYAKRIGLVFEAVVEAVLRNESKRRERSFFDGQGDWLETQFRLVADWVHEHGEWLTLDAFDYGHRELIGDRRDVRREDFAAFLARSCMFVQANVTADLFSPTASLPKLLALSGNGRSTCFVSRDVTDHFTAMRLCMQEIGYHYVDLKKASRDGLAFPTFVDFLLLDPTPAGGQKSHAQDPEDDEEFATSAIRLAQQLPRIRDRFGLALLVVPHSECVAKRWQREIREALLAEHMLAAVVDLPASATTGRRRFSAWLITGQRAVLPAYRRHVLFIDAEPLGRLTPAHDPAVTGDFIGALIAPIFRADGHRKRLLARLHEAEPLLANIFRREFDEDKFEAPGLARSVPHEEILDQDAALAAKPYLTALAGDLWERGIDRRQLDVLLEKRVAKGRRIYIIGNNGEGKSLLLRDIALESAARQRRTVVIAFSASDRFPRQVATRYRPFYRYMGARTNTTGINTLQAAVDAGALMLRIHADPASLGVLNRVLDLIGFASQLFMIPRELKANSGQRSSLIGGIVRLASQDEGDRKVIENLSRSAAQARRYKLGLRRAHHRDSILPFDELSSGEQQIIMLAAKMISEAGPDVLFLVDEPEISLHVGWQRIVPKLFETIAREFGAEILVATHSPILVASADRDGDHCFTVRDRALNELSLADRNSVETALFEGFRTYTTNNREVHERCAALVAKFIDEANGGDDPRESVKPIVDKLDDMKQVIDNQRKFVARDDMRFDVNLIEQAKAALKEMAALAAEDAADDAADEAAEDEQ